MTLKSVASVSLCALALTACAKTSPLLEDKKDYIGEWKNDTSSLEIKKNGDAKYIQHLKNEDKTASSDIKTSSVSDIKAPITQFDTQHFQIGQGGLSKEFQITKAPYQQDGKWQIVLNGEVYTRH